MPSSSDLALPRELILMILIQLMLFDQPRILHLKRYVDTVTGRGSVAFHGNLNITQPPITQLGRVWREWAKDYYVLAFAAIVGGRSNGGLWIRRDLDLVYVDTAFCSFSLRTLSHTNCSMRFVTKLAVDATLLNDGVGRLGYVSLLDEVLTYFWNVENLVFMAPTRENPLKNRYRGLRLVEQEEDKAQKQLAFTNFYHCGAIVTNTAQNAIMIARSPEAPSGTPIRTRMSSMDTLRRLLVDGCPMNVIVFQREGMRAPRVDTVVGPQTMINRALSIIGYRMHPEPVSASEMMALVEESKTRVRPSAPPARTGRLFVSNIRWTIW